MTRQAPGIVTVLAWTVNAAAAACGVEVAVAPRAGLTNVVEAEYTVEGRTERARPAVVVISLGPPVVRRGGGPPLEDASLAPVSGWQAGGPPVSNGKSSPSIEAASARPEVARAKAGSPWRRGQSAPSEALAYAAPTTLCRAEGPIVKPGQVGPPSSQSSFTPGETSGHAVPPVTPSKQGPPVDVAVGIPPVESDATAPRSSEGRYGPPVLNPDGGPPVVSDDTIPESSQEKDAPPVARAQGGPPILFLQKTGLGPLRPGSTEFTYHIRYRNTGNSKIQGLKILDHLPAAQVPLKCTGAGLEVNRTPEAGGTLIEFRRRGVLLPGESGSAYVTVRLPGGPR